MWGETDFCKEVTVRVVRIVWREVKKTRKQMNQNEYQNESK
jgi:hypothetical protein